MNKDSISKALKSFLSRIFFTPVVVENLFNVEVICRVEKSICGLVTNNAFLNARSKSLAPRSSLVLQEMNFLWCLFANEGLVPHCDEERKDTIQCFNFFKPK